MFRDTADQFQKYQKTLLEAEVGYWELELSTMTLSWDEGYRRLFEKEEGSYKSFLSSDFNEIHEDYRPKLIEYFNQVLTDDSKISANYRIHSKKQETKYVRLSARRNKVDGKVVSISGVCWDFTSETLLRRELIAAKEFTENILNTIPAPVFVKNENFEMVYANSEYQKFTGFAREKFIGKSDYDIYPKELADSTRKTDTQVFNTDKPLEYEISVKNGRGENRDLYAKKSLIKMSYGKNFLVVAALDITELKKVQESLVKQSKMASLGEMAAEIAHEVNNPLMIIQGKSQILISKIKSQKFDQDSIQKDLEQIETNCVRIDKIIKSLKSVTRKADLDPFEDVSLLSLIDEAFQISIVRFKKKNLSLIISCDSQINAKSHISGRPSEIVQVLVNLLNNSYDAIQDQNSGWAKINITSKKSFFLIEISDSGSEIHPDIVQKMMEPFFTTKSAGKGTGLGLSVSKQIIRNHGGELYYDPARPHTCFVFTIPKK